MGENRENFPRSPRNRANLKEIAIMTGRGGTGGGLRAGVADPKKISGELFSLTYGALVAQILKDYESVDDVNKQLEKMGHNIGVRLVEDFLSRTNSQKCSDFRDVSDKIQLGFKMFLNISPTVTGWSATADEFSLLFENNPLAEFVELPDSCYNLRYSNILCGPSRELWKWSTLRCFAGLFKTL